MEVLPIMTIGEKIYNFRKGLNLTQKDFAKQAGVAQSAVNYWENGKRQPRIEQLQKIAAAFNIPLSTFINVRATEEVDEHIFNTLLDELKNTEASKKELLTEILKAHGYTIERRKNNYIITFQDIKYSVSNMKMNTFFERCDKDIRYNIEKLLNDSKQLD